MILFFEGIHFNDYSNLLIKYGQVMWCAYYLEKRTDIFLTSETPTVTDLKLPYKIR
jgi:hypothetical protein